MPRIADKLAEVTGHIEELCTRSGREPDSVHLIAVSKTRSLEQVEQAIAAGQRQFGENTMQDALTKIPALSSPELQWHFIGHLQSKKAGQIPGNFQWVHSVDSLKLAQKLSTAMYNWNPSSQLNCLLQVNVSNEVSKSGLPVSEVKPLLEKLLHQELTGLVWRGLMTIGVQGDEVKTGQAFSSLRVLRDDCRQEFGLSAFDQLSMGMSDDYALAIEQGATLLRLGTALFGSRKPA